MKTNKIMRSKKRERVKKAIQLMIDNCNDKYFKLVWYARCDQQKRLEEECYEALKSCREIEKKYPEEVKALSEDDNWSHGFNSGMLAASRLYLSMIEYDVEQALEDFPELDS